MVLAKGYGVADVASHRPMTPDTIVPVASISKMFTALAAVQLADRGRLDLHADANRYLRTVRVPAAFGKPVTAAAPQRRPAPRFVHATDKIPS